MSCSKISIPRGNKIPFRKDISGNCCIIHVLDFKVTKINICINSTYHVHHAHVLDKLERSKRPRHDACDPIISIKWEKFTLKNLTIGSNKLVYDMLTFKSCHEAEGGNPVTKTASRKEKSWAHAFPLTSKTRNYLIMLTAILRSSRNPTTTTTTTVTAIAIPWWRSSSTMCKLDLHMQEKMI